jgi:hypothetical protein
MLFSSSHCYRYKLGQLRWSTRTGLPEGARNVTLAGAEYRTNVTLRCFHPRSNVTPAAGNVTLMSIEVHSNVTLGARNVTLTPEWAEFSNGEGAVL